MGDNRRMPDPSGALRVGVVGCGAFGRNHARVYGELQAHSGHKLHFAGVADSDFTRAQAIAREYGTEAYGSVDELIAAGVNAVSVAVPTVSHREVAGRLMQSGVDVLIEKPLAVTIAEADELIALARRHDRIAQVGHLERFNPAILAAEPMLSRPRFIECHRLAPFRERGTDVNVVLDLMIHDIDLVQMIVGSPVASLDAVGTPVFSSEIDIANARLRFENGCVANVTASRVSLKTERKLRVFRDDAYLSLDLQQKILTVIRKRAVSGAGELPVQIEEQSFAQGDALLAEIRAFLSAIRGEGPVVVSGEDGERALRTAIQISEVTHA